MIKTIKISRFRSIKESSLELAPLTFLYGNNASGKSSVFYALNVFRNILLNPNQQVDAFFNLTFANLGGFRQVVFRHEEAHETSISASSRIDNILFTNGVTIKGSAGVFSLDIGKPYSLKFNLPVSFPYPSNVNDKQEYKTGEVTFGITWNGTTFQVTPDPVSEENSKRAQEMSAMFNGMGEKIRGIDVVPVRRGFTKPQYGIVSSSKFPANEDEIASKLASDEYLDSKVSTYLEQIIGRQFRAKTAPGTSLVSLTTTEKESKQTTEIVNDGFGTNQLVYLLAKVLNKDSGVVCVEEPEINLHPGVVRKLPSVFIELARDEKKQLIISTHSVDLIIAMLAAVSKGEIKPENVACYLTTRQDGISSFARQNISKEGQIEGGLTAFMEGELDNIRGFFEGKGSRKEKEGEEALDDFSENENVEPDNNR